MNPSVSIPVRVINATHTGGYFDLYFIFLQETQDARAAYEATEAELVRYGFPPRYSCYQSFRVSLRRSYRVISRWKNETLFRDTTGE
jgi:hypothetical protein